MKPRFTQTFFLKVLPFIILAFLASTGLSAQTGADAKTGISHAKPDSVVFPQAIGWVNDFEDIIDSATEVKLTNLILDHNKKTSNQIAIVTISSISPYTALAEFTSDLSNAWGVGEKGKNNGVTIIFSKALREVRITTGLGIEQKLNDALCQKIVDQYMIPAFKDGDYGMGMMDGVSEIIRILELK